ncbi:MAG: hypothetical protein WAZ21_00920 [Candidatus Saccharimonadales bacterium]
MDIFGSLAIVAFAGLIHASFQLSVSMLSLMSGHAIGAKRSHSKLMRLIGGFIFGAGVMTMLLLSFISLVLLHIFNGSSVLALAWVMDCGLLFGIGIAVWLFYYRRQRGTTLWIPRSAASYLSERTKVTKRSAEAFGLGLTSVISELLFIIAPVVTSALVIISLPPLWQLTGIALYTAISLLSLLIVSVLVGGGHKLSLIQKWREKNKTFLQFCAGSGLIILGFYLYVNQVLAVDIASLGGM